MSKWHLYSEWKNGKYDSGIIQFVWLYGIIGCFVLILACINFMNLSTARSEKRMKEVGIRKVLGSARGQLIYQFLSESLLTTLFAFLFALCIISFSLRWFNELAGKQISLPLAIPYFWLLSLGFVFFTGLIAGSYPAFYLSSFLPMKVLKGTLTASRFSSISRKVLVVFQFTISLTLVVGTIVVYQQIHYGKNRPVGYQRGGLLMVQKTSSDFDGKTDVLRTELKNTGMVEEVAESTGPTTEIWSSNGGFDWKGKDPDFNPEFATLAVTPEYGKTIDWQLVDGRDFSHSFLSDSSSFVINESAAKLMKMVNPIGELIHWNPRFRKPDNFKVIGVVKDMVMKSPYESPKPTVFFMGGKISWINIKINPNVEVGDTLKSIEAVFKKVIPSIMFSYKFADQEYDLKFKAEENIGQLATVFSTLAILISCLGLWGLTSYVAEQRTKEIGIRKVLGASIFNLWKMLSGDFALLVAFSVILALPLSYYLMDHWLMNYEYRTEISLWTFLMVSFGSLCLTSATVSYQTIRAALANPAESLRSE